MRIQLFIATMVLPCVLSCSDDLGIEQTSFACASQEDCSPGWQCAFSPQHARQVCQRTMTSAADTSTNDEVHPDGSGCPCEGDAMCIADVCVTPEDCDGMWCDDVCVDPRSDPQHCGRCENACSTGGDNMIVGVCDEGTCGAPTCKAGFGDCDGTGDDCETDLGSDPAHCGRCDRACHVGDQCTEAGQCSVVEIVASGQRSIVGLTTVLGDPDRFYGINEVMESIVVFERVSGSWKPVSSFQEGVVDAYLMDGGLRWESGC